MKSSMSLIERPSELIDKIERGWWGNGHMLTPKQSREIWCWIEEIEDELNTRRLRADERMVPFKTIHDNPEDYFDDITEDWKMIDDG